MTTPRRFRKRPVVVEAVQWTGFNLEELREWGATTTFDQSGPARRVVPAPGGPGSPLNLWVEANGAWLPIDPGEWVVRDRLGFYPVKDEVFVETYEEAT